MSFFRTLTRSAMKGDSYFTDRESTIESVKEFRMSNNIPEHLTIQQWIDSGFNSNLPFVENLKK